MGSTETAPGGRPDRAPSSGGRWGFAVVRGDSMRPTLRPGDRLWVSYRASPRAGDVVVATLPDGTGAVKRAVERRRTANGRAGWWLLSDDPARGVDSRHRGPVHDEQVHGVVRWRVWPRPGPVRRRAPGQTGAGVVGPGSAAEPGVED